MSQTISMQELLETGAHYGHRTNLWNPKMAKYIYGSRNGIHIIDLGLTVKYLKKALKIIKEVAAKNGRILFVGTKKQASEIISSEATRCGQYYVNHRWLGGMLTNWDTISASLKKLQKYEDLLSNPNISLNKKEKLNIDRKRIKLDNVLGGIRNMGGKPDILFVIDTNLESLAITEAKKLKIPVVAIVDTNSNPDNVNHMIPGNDDARKAIELYTRLITEAVLEGMQESMVKSGTDIGAMDNIKSDVTNKELENKNTSNDNKESIQENNLQTKSAENLIGDKKENNNE